MYIEMSALPSTQVRIRNREGLVLTKGGTYLTHIEFDATGMSDFSRSYLDLQVAWKNAGGNYLPAGTNVFLGDAGDNVAYDGQAIVRNCRLTCEQFGILEEQIKVNVYHQSLRKLTQSRQLEQSQRVFGNERLVCGDSGVTQILIPLSSVLGCGTEIYPNMKMGNSTIRLELEFQKDIAYWLSDELRNFDLPCSGSNVAGALTAIDTTTLFESQTSVDWWFQAGKIYNITGTYNAGNINVSRELATAVWDDGAGTATLTFTTPILTIVAPNVFDDVFVASVAPSAVSCEDATADANGDIMTLTCATADTTDLITGLVHSVGYVEEDNGTAYFSTAVLTDILISTADPTKSILYFDVPIIVGLQAGTDAVDVFIVPYQEEDPAVWEVQQIDLVLHKLLQPVKMDKFQFETLSVEMTNQPLTQNYRKQFYLENDAYKFVYLTPLNTLISEQNEAATYRLTLNNIDLTNRDIPIDPDTNGSLYNDRLVMNVDGLASVQPHNGDLTTIVYPDRCPFGQQNMLEVKIDSNGVDEMASCLGHLFKTRLRAF
jgi:hypothetical protein